MKEERKAFVLMPFNTALKEVYDEVYKPVCEANEVDCYRVDEISRPGSITQDIVEGILDADIVIADLTGKNPNVFYELGIAHSVGNKTIMTSQSKEDVPFDIANYRIVFYEQSIRGSKKLYSDIDATIKELLKTIEQTNNPVQEVFSKRSVVGIRKRTPIFKEISIGSLNLKVRNVFEGEGILYADELRKVDLEEIKVKYHLGQKTLSQFVRVILRYDAYDDIEYLNKFILKYRLETADRYASY